MENLAGMSLEEALEYLVHCGIQPQVVFSEPPRPPNDQVRRTARIVRYENNVLLCSYFSDTSPEDN
jgi:hypothetical protein